jgi:adhesin/invasin
LDDRVSIDRILKIEPVGPPPLVAPAGVVSSAGFKDPAAMGGLATLFGTGLIDQDGVVTAPGFPLPMKLAGLSVWFGTKPAPILAVARVNGQEQVNVQVPAEADGAIKLERGGALAFVFDARYSAFSPTIFVDADGRPAITHADFSLVTPANPVRSGETIIIFGTGLGAVDPPVPDGEAAPSSPLSQTRTLPVVTIGGQNATIAFSGLAPGFAGLYQVNVVVPAVPPGEATLTIGSASSAHDTAVIAVQ